MASSSRLTARHLRLDEYEVVHQRAVHTGMVATLVCRQKGWSSLLRLVIPAATNVERWIPGGAKYVPTKDFTCFEKSEILQYARHAPVLWTYCILMLERCRLFLHSTQLSFHSLPLPFAYACSPSAGYKGLLCLPCFAAGIGRTP